MYVVPHLPLTEAGVRVRLMREADAEPYADGANDGAVRTYAHLPEPEYTAASVRRLIATEFAAGLSTGGLAVLALADDHSDEFVGSLVLFDVRDRTAEVGFWVHPRARRRGVARTSLRLALVLGERCGLDELRAKTTAANAGSRRVIEDSGFIRQGVVREPTPSGEVADLLEYRASVGRRTRTS